MALDPALTSQHTVSRFLSAAAGVAYSALAYLAFLASALWSVGFLADRAAPSSVDGPAMLGSGASWPVALGVDALLLLLFAVQHSVMARPAVKRVLTRVVPPHLERSTFVLAASLVLILLVVAWQPVDAVVWDVGTPWSALLWAAYAVGWALVVASTFMIDHLDFLGLKQAARQAAGRTYEPPAFTQRWLYRWCRHPMMLGLLVAFWASPRMSVGHLFFAALGTGYILVGIRFEEHELRRELGTDYEEYARSVPALVPTGRR